MHEVARTLAPARILARGTASPCVGGITWFENSTIGAVHLGSVEAAEARLTSWLGCTAAMYRRPWLCGFSNGRTFARRLLMRHPTPFAGAALLSAPLVSMKPLGLLPRHRPGSAGRGADGPSAQQRRRSAQTPRLAERS